MHNVRDVSDQRRNHSCNNGGEHGLPDGVEDREEIRGQIRWHVGSFGHDFEEIERQKHAHRPKEAPQDVEDESQVCKGSQEPEDVKLFHAMLESRPDREDGQRLH